MKNLSQSFKRQLFNNERNYIVYADITLADNTTLSLTNSEIWTNGFSFEECVSNDDSFDALGAVIVGSAEIVLDNTADTYSEYDFTDANVVLHIGMDVPQLDGTTVLEKIKIGVYTVNEPTYNGGTIRLGLLDNMILFDKPYNTSLTYPATLDAIVRDACTKCGVVLGTLNFPNKNVVIANAPNSDSLTFRTVISWAAMIAGCFAKINPDGKLILAWFDYSALEYAFNTLDGGTFNPWTGGDLYDGGTFNPWTGGESYGNTEFLEDHPVCRISSIYSQTIATDDVVITGVRAIVNSESNTDEQSSKTYVSGTDGYVIELTNNDFITEDTAQDIVNRLGTQIIGLRFRKLNISCANDPSIEAGDVAIVVDRKQNAYVALVTRSSFSVGGSQTIVSGASTPQRNSATQFSSASKTYVEMRKRIKREQNARELAEQSIRQTIANANGLYITQQADTQDPTKTQYYLHNKVQLAESDIRIWFSDAGIMVTSNGTAQSPNWYGLTVNGDMLLNLLIATGISANWINTGQLVIEDQNGNETFFADTQTGIVRINAQTFSLSGQSIGNIVDTKLVPVNNKLTQEGIYMLLTANETIPGIFMQNGQLYINASYIQTGTLKLGGANDQYGNYKLLDAQNRVRVEMGKFSYDRVKAVFTGYLNPDSNTPDGKIEITDRGELAGYKYVSNTWKELLLFNSQQYSGESTNNVAVIRSGSNANSLKLSTTGDGYNPMIQLFKSDQSGSAYMPSGTTAFNYRTRIAGDVYISDSGRLVIPGSYDSIIYRLACGILNVGDLTCSGTKNRKVSTRNYSERLLYCFETPSPMFGDVGEGVINEDGKCYVTIDPVFAETISLTQYQVFLQKYGAGDCYVSERKSSYFIVEGTPNMTFGWELKAKQSDYSQRRLDIPEQVFKDDTDYASQAIVHIQDLQTDYGQEAIDHITNIMKERIIA